MDKFKMKSIANDKFNFLENYLKFNIPNAIYHRKIRNTVKRSSSISEYQLPNRLKKDIRKYWDRYDKKVNMEWHRAYTATNSVEDVRYIPENIFYKEILPHFNRMELSTAYSDKNMYDKMFQNFNRPKTVVRNINGIFSDENYT